MKYTHTILTIVTMIGLTAVLPAAAPGQGPTEHGTIRAGGLEVTLLSAPPLSPAEMQKLMPGMGGMGDMQGMGGMRGGVRGMEGMMRGMPGMGSMSGGEAHPTHWIGVIVRDLREDRVVQDVAVTLAARKGGWTRTVTLMPMPGSYGANLRLPEKGRYTVTVTIDRPGQPVRVGFEFDYS